MFKTITRTVILALMAGGIAAQNPTWTNSLRGPFTPISLNASDGSISAAFIPHGATLTELWVKDKNGTARDITLGYDNKTLFADDPGHPNFGTIVSEHRGPNQRDPGSQLTSLQVGRYANRIKNNTYTDTETNMTYYSEANENKGLDT